jgi:hypothetical protein
MVSTPSIHVPRKRKTKSKDPNHISRPMNPFILFRSHLAQLNPGMDQREFSKLAGEFWENMKQDGRDKEWIEKAEEEKKKHKAAHPGYRYQPMSREMREREGEEARTRREVEKEERKQASRDAQKAQEQRVKEQASQDQAASRSRTPVDHPLPSTIESSIQWTELPIAVPEVRTHFVVVLNSFLNPFFFWQGRQPRALTGVSPQFLILLMEIEISTNGPNSPRLRDPIEWIRQTAISWGCVPVASSSGTAIQREGTSNSRSGGRPIAPDAVPEEESPSGARYLYKEAEQLFREILMIWNFRYGPIHVPQEGGAGRVYDTPLASSDTSDDESNCDCDGCLLDNASSPAHASEHPIASDYYAVPPQGGDAYALDPSNEFSANGGHVGNTSTQGYPPTIVNPPGYFTYPRRGDNN